MPVRKTKRTRKSEFPPSIVCLLHCGHDHLGELVGGVAGNLDLLRAAWQDPEIRAAVYERFTRQGHKYMGEPWAESRFGK